MSYDKNSVSSSNSGQILDDELASKINNALDDVSSDSDDDLSAQFRSLSQPTLSETTVRLLPEHRFLKANTTKTLFCDFPVLNR